MATSPIRGDVWLVDLGMVASVKLIRRLGRLPDAHMTDVENAVKHWLGFQAGS